MWSTEERNDKMRKIKRKKKYGDGGRTRSKKLGAKNVKECVG